MKRNVKKPLKKYPERATEVLVTQKMLYLVRDELKSDILSVKEGLAAVKLGQDSLKLGQDSFRLGLDSLSAGQDSLKLGQDSLWLGLDAIKSGLASSEARIMSVIREIKSELNEIRAESHRNNLLAEEQKNQNNIVLDGLAGLFHRQERVEEKLDNFERRKPFSK